MGAWRENIDTGDPALHRDTLSSNFIWQNPPFVLMDSDLFLQWQVLFCRYSSFAQCFRGLFFFFAGWSWFFSVSDTHSKISWVETTPSLKTRLLPQLPAACPRLVELCPKGVSDISDHGPMDHVHSYWKLPFFMGKNTISMAIFHSYVENYQRVVPAPKNLCSQISRLSQVMSPQALQ